MSFTRLAALGVVFLLPYGNKLLQQTSPAWQPSPQAPAIVQDMASATGWNAVNLPADAQAIGILTIEDGSSPETFPVTLSAKGCRLFRSDVQFSDGIHSTIVNQDSAAAITPATTQVLPSFSALSINSFEVPFFCLPSVLAAANLSFAGTESVAGQSAYRIEINPIVSSTDPLVGSRQTAGELTLWISTASGMPVQLRSRLVAPYSAAVSVDVLRVFSDFRVVSGIAVPFQQQQFTQGRLRSTLRLSSVVFNMGVPDSAFSIPAPQ